MKSDRKEAKIVLIGDTQVGKTSILKRVTTKKFSTNYVPTVGAAYATHHLQADNVSLSLQAWDTAGQKQYHCLVPMFLQNATIVVVVYSVTDKRSFESVDVWLQRLKDQADPKVIKFLVGNKADLNKKREVTAEEGRKKANSNNAVFYEVSVKTRLGINELFDAFSKEICRERSRNDINIIS